MSSALIETQSDNLFVEHVCNSFSVHKEQLGHGMVGDLYVYTGLMESTFTYQGRSGTCKQVLSSVAIVSPEDEGSDDDN